jgi:peptidyl-tRNA hydrolase
MRAGIGTGEVMKKDDFVDFVLTNFSDEELEKFRTMLPNYNACITDFLTQDIKTLMNRYNRNFLKTEEPPENPAAEVIKEK